MIAAGRQSDQFIAIHRIDATVIKRKLLSPLFLVLQPYYPHLPVPLPHIFQATP